MERGKLRGPFRVRISPGPNEKSRTLRRGQSITIGSGEKADLVVTDRAVSALHCRLSVSEHGLEIADLASRNGVVVGAGWVERLVVAAPRTEFSIGATLVRIENLEFERDAPELGLLGSSEGMERVREKVRRYAELTAPVLVVGESGTGKDLVARALHQASKRSGAYVPLNAAALPDALAEAELFGHARGAFTGAVTSRSGAFELAHRGTLFLDEIAEMSLPCQAKLLRVVEDGIVRPLGGAQVVRVETRLVSATCAPLADRRRDGRFREDLFHRLSLLTIEVPPLRRRTTDIAELARAFFAQKERELGPKFLLPAAEEFLARQDWPGNVRQLFGALYRAAVASDGESLGPEHFDLLAARDARSTPPAPERAEELLHRHGSVSAAARAAGIPRTTFRSLLRRSLAASAALAVAEPEPEPEPGRE